MAAQRKGYGAGQGGVDYRKGLAEVQWGRATLNIVRRPGMAMAVYKQRCESITS